MGHVPSTLCSSSGQDFSTVLRPESGQETKGSLSLQGVWLVGVTSRLESSLHQAHD